MRLPFRAVLAALAAAAPGLAAQALPQTTAERTDYAATSTNAEVGAFLDSLELAGARPSLRDGHLRARPADLLRDRLRPDGDVPGRSGGVRKVGGVPAGEHPRRGSRGEGSRARTAARAGGSAPRAAADPRDPRGAGLQPRRQRRPRPAGGEPL